MNTTGRGGVIMNTVDLPDRPILTDTLMIEVISDALSRSGVDVSRDDFRGIRIFVSYNDMLTIEHLIAPGYNGWRKLESAEVEGFPRLSVGRHQWIDDGWAHVERRKTGRLTKTFDVKLFMSEHHRLELAERVAER